MDPSDHGTVAAAASSCSPFSCLLAAPCEDLGEPTTDSPHRSASNSACLSGDLNLRAPPSFLPSSRPSSCVVSPPAVVSPASPFVLSLSLLPAADGERAQSSGGALAEEEARRRRDSGSRCTLRDASAGSTPRSRLWQGDREETSAREAMTKLDVDAGAVCGNAEGHPEGFSLREPDEKERKRGESSVSSTEEEDACMLRLSDTASRDRHIEGEGGGASGASALVRTEGQGRHAPTVQNTWAINSSSRAASGSLDAAEEDVAVCDPDDGSGEPLGTPPHAANADNGEPRPVSSECLPEESEEGGERPSFAPSTCIFMSSASSGALAARAPEFRSSLCPLEGERRGTAEQTVCEGETEETRDVGADEREDDEGKGRRPASARGGLNSCGAASGPVWSSLAEDRESDATNLREAPRDALAIEPKRVTGASSRVQEEARVETNSPARTVSLSPRSCGVGNDTLPTPRTPTQLADSAPQREEREKEVSDAGRRSAGAQRAESHSGLGERTSAEGEETGARDERPAAHERLHTHDHVQRDAQCQVGQNTDCVCNSNNGKARDESEKRKAAAAEEERGSRGEEEGRETAEQEEVQTEETQRAPHAIRSDKGESTRKVAQEAVTASREAKQREQLSSPSRSAASSQRRLRRLEDGDDTENEEDCRCIVSSKSSNGQPDRDFGRTKKTLENDRITFDTTKRDSVQRETTVTAEVHPRRGIGSRELCDDPEKSKGESKEAENAPGFHAKKTVPLDSGAFREPRLALSSTAGGKGHARRGAESSAEGGGEAEELLQAVGAEDAEGWQARTVDEKTEIRSSQAEERATSEADAGESRRKTPTPEATRESGGDQTRCTEEHRAAKEERGVSDDTSTKQKSMPPNDMANKTDLLKEEIAGVSAGTVYSVAALLGFRGDFARVLFPPPKPSKCSEQAGGGVSLSLSLGAASLSSSAPQKHKDTPSGKTHLHLSPVPSFEANTVAPSSPSSVSSASAPRTPNSGDAESVRGSSGSTERTKASPGYLRPSPSPRDADSSGFPKFMMVSRVSQRLPLAGDHTHPHSGPNRQDGPSRLVDGRDGGVFYSTYARVAADGEAPRMMEAAGDHQRVCPLANSPMLGAQNGRRTNPALFRGGAEGAGRGHHPAYGYRQSSHAVGSPSLRSSSSAMPSLSPLPSGGVSRATASGGEFAGLRAPVTHSAKQPRGSAGDRCGSRSGPPPSSLLPRASQRGPLSQPPTEDAAGRELRRRRGSSGSESGERAACTATSEPSQSRKASPSRVAPPACGSVLAQRTSLVEARGHLMGPAGSSRRSSTPNADESSTGELASALSGGSRASRLHTRIHEDRGDREETLSVPVHLGASEKNSPARRASSGGGLPLPETREASGGPLGGGGAQDARRPSILGAVPRTPSTPPEGRDTGRRHSSSARASDDSCVESTWSTASLLSLCVAPQRKAGGDSRAAGAEQGKEIGLGSRAKRASVVDADAAEPGDKRAEALHTNNQVEVRREDGQEGEHVSGAAKGRRGDRRNREGKEKTRIDNSQSAGKECGGMTAASLCAASQSSRSKRKTGAKGEEETKRAGEKTGANAEPATQKCERDAQGAAGARRDGGRGGRERLAQGEAKGAEDGERGHERRTAEEDPCGGRKGKDRERDRDGAKGIPSLLPSSAGDGSGEGYVCKAAKENGVAAPSSSRSARKKGSASREKKKSPGHLSATAASPAALATRSPNAGSEERQNNNGARTGGEGKREGRKKSCWTAAAVSPASSALASTTSASPFPLSPRASRPTGAAGSPEDARSSFASPSLSSGGAACDKKQTQFGAVAPSAAELSGAAGVTGTVSSRTKPVAAARWTPFAKAGEYRNAPLSFPGDGGGVAGAHPRKTAAQASSANPVKPQPGNLLGSVSGARAAPRARRNSLAPLSSFADLLPQEPAPHARGGRRGGGGEREIWDAPEAGLKEAKSGDTRDGLAAFFTLGDIRQAERAIEGGEMSLQQFVAYKKEKCRREGEERKRQDSLEGGEGGDGESAASRDEEKEDEQRKRTANREQQRHRDTERRCKSGEQETRNGRPGAAGEQHEESHMHARANIAVGLGGVALQQDVEEEFSVFEYEDPAAVTSESFFTSSSCFASSSYPSSASLSELLAPSHRGESGAEKGKPSPGKSFSLLNVAEGRLVSGALGWSAAETGFVPPAREGSGSPGATHARQGGIFAEDNGKRARTGPVSASCSNGRARRANGAPTQPPTHHAVGQTVIPPAGSSHATGVAEDCGAGRSLLSHKQPLDEETGRAAGRRLLALLGVTLGSPPAPQQPPPVGVSRAAGGPRARPYAVQQPPPRRAPSASIASPPSAASAFSHIGRRREGAHCGGASPTTAHTPHGGGSAASSVPAAAASPLRSTGSLSSAAALSSFRSLLAALEAQTNAKKVLGGALGEEKEGAAADRAKAEQELLARLERAASSLTPRHGAPVQASSPAAAFSGGRQGTPPGFASSFRPSAYGGVVPSPAPEAPRVRPAFAASCSSPADGSGAPGGSSFTPSHSQLPHFSADSFSPSGLPHASSASISRLPASPLSHAQSSASVPLSAASAFGSSSFATRGLVCGDQGAAAAFSRFMAASSPAQRAEIEGALKQELRERFASALRRGREAERERLREAEGYGRGAEAGQPGAESQAFSPFRKRESGSPQLAAALALLASSAANDRTGERGERNAEGREQGRRGPERAQTPGGDAAPQAALLTALRAVIQGNLQQPGA
ncbi:hypothetical protein BESB_006910 [Besnoitia besnoiti]|uniref:Uncharacterized protein n=1 Tax=Besnoitia besnoiti TaxID=94643 RepID=A0A2A9MQK9_BESBE|nr:hypothetical protein BESB_006910 [Besnoitia besnoiti]PFH38350.1 hypothetical protein BESB_006910 [Besnoitia besnoiti]